MGKPKVISLFSGIGGFDKAFEDEGFEIVAQAEWNKNASKVLAHHYPNVPNLGDVNNVGRHNLPYADVIVGGSPCQGFSSGGKHGGLQDERSGQWYQFLRIIEETTPQFIVFENVKGILSTNGGRDFAEVVQGMAKLRYGVAWRSFDARFFGVAQRRKRVFIVASFTDMRASQVLFEQKGSGGDTATGRKKKQATTAKVENSFGEDMYVIDAFNMSGYNQSFSDTDIAATITSTSFKHPETLISNGNIGVRRITPVEAARLMGFPDDWNDIGLSDTARYGQYGNAVAVPVVRWIAKRLLNVMNGVENE